MAMITWTELTEAKESGAKDLNPYYHKFDSNGNLNRSDSQIQTIGKDQQLTG
jgi:hypothetical protein